MEASIDTPKGSAGLDAFLGDLGFFSLLRQTDSLEDECRRLATNSPFTGYGVKSAQGLSKRMEDSYSVQETLGSPQCFSSPQFESSLGENPEAEEPSINIPGFSEDLAFFSVFDGHGGDEVAQHCSDNLHRHFTSLLMSSVNGTVSLPSSPVSVQSAPQIMSTSKSGTLESTSSVQTNNSVLVCDALRSSFRKTDSELAGTEAGEFVGATAVVAVVGKQHIWVAHCGDSRAVILRNGDAIALTSDHKPDREDEAARIRSAGGRVVSNGRTSRVNGFLAMSRSIGDHHLRPYVIAEPEVSSFDRCPEDEVLIIATDGLWDVFTCTEATNLASRCVTRSKERGMSMCGACRVAASVLAKSAIERGSKDNITVIVVDISPPPSSTGGICDNTELSSFDARSSSSMVHSSHGGSSRNGGSSLDLQKSNSMGTYVLLKSQKKPEKGHKASRRTADGSLGLAADAQDQTTASLSEGKTGGPTYSRFKSSPVLSKEQSGGNCSDSSSNEDEDEDTDEDDDAPDDDEDREGGRGGDRRGGESSSGSEDDECPASGGPPEPAGPSANKGGLSGSNDEAGKEPSSDAGHGQDQNACGGSVAGLQKCPSTFHSSQDASAGVDRDTDLLNLASCPLRSEPSAMSSLQIGLAQVRQHVHHKCDGDNRAFTSADWMDGKVWREHAGRSLSVMAEQNFDDSLRPMISSVSCQEEVRQRDVLV